MWLAARRRENEEDSLTIRAFVMVVRSNDSTAVEVARLKIRI